MPSRIVRTEFLITVRSPLGPGRRQNAPLEIDRADTSSATLCRPQAGQVLTKPPPPPVFTVLEAVPVAVLPLLFWTK